MRKEQPTDFSIDDLYPCTGAGSELVGQELETYMVAPSVVREAEIPDQITMIGSVASGGRTVASRSSSAPKPTTARRRLMGVEHREELLIRIGCEKQIGDWNAWHSPSQQKSGRQGTDITDEPQHQHTSSIARDIKKQQGLLTGLPFP